MRNEFDSYSFGAEPQKGVDYVSINVTAEQLEALLNPPPLTSVASHGLASNENEDVYKKAEELAYLMHISTVLDEPQRRAFEDALEKKQGIRLGLMES